MIAPQPFYSERGTPMNVKLLCQVLGGAGHQVELLVFPRGKDIELENLRIIRLPNLLRVKFIPVGPSFTKLFFDILLTLTSFLLIITKNYDVIHGIEEGGFVAVILAKIFKKTSIFDMDSCISDQLKYSGFIQIPSLLRLVEALEKWCLGKSSCAITVCQALSEKARQLSPDVNIFQIEDVPISNLNKSENGSTDELIGRFKLENMITILYTGNLESYQGIDLLLDAWEAFFSLLGNNFKKYKLVIVGGNEEQIAYYKKIASKKGIRDYICWVGQRPSEEMSAWMKLSHVLVSPRSEGNNTPLKIYSYMESGRPIIATKRKTHTQVLDDSMAFLVDPDPLHFAITIKDVVSNFDVANKKAKIAKQEVEKNYNYRVFQRKLLEVYNTISIY
jgi:glycosyltransferase involved in cell wall biosynthesis